MSAFSSPANTLNASLTNLGTTKGAKYISIHTASPGTTGANELVGGSYGRIATTWAGPAAGSMAGSQVTIQIPASTITHWGIWDAASGGNYYDGGALPSSQVYSSAGTYLLTPTWTAS